jgi:uncharacterized protein YecT (DUF1311 family)
LGRLHIGQNAPVSGLQVVARLGALAATLALMSCSSSQADGAQSSTTVSRSLMAESTTFEDCYTGTQAELNQCAARELDYYEALLGDVFDDVRHRADPAEQRMLDDTHEQWRSYRDQFCESYLQREGSIQPLNSAACKVDLTMQRGVALCRWENPNVADESAESCASTFKG